MSRATRAAAALGGSLMVTVAAADDFLAVTTSPSPDALVAFDSSDPAAADDDQPVALLAGNFVRGLVMENETSGWYVATDSISGSATGFFRLENGVSTRVAPLPFETGTGGGLCLSADGAFLFWLTDPSTSSVPPNDQLWRLDFDGSATLIDTIFYSHAGDPSFSGLAVHPGTGDLYALEGVSNALALIDPVTGAGSRIGTTIGVDIAGVGGLDFTADGRLLASVNTSGDVYEINLTTGVGSLVGRLGFNCSSIARIPSAVPCPADLTGDGAVNVFDLLEVLGGWGACAKPQSCPADLTGDDHVNVFDLLDLLGQWGSCV